MIWASIQKILKNTPKLFKNIKMNKFIKIEKYRSIHTNQIVFLYTSTEQSENEIKKTIAPTLV